MEQKNMTEIFKGYSNYSEEEYKKIWEEATIVIDTNIILNFYRYSNETREEIYTTLKNIKERLWIPYQVAYEYFNNKGTVISDSYKIFNELQNETASCFDKLKNMFNSKAEKQLKCKETILGKLESYFEEIDKIINEEKESRKESASEEKVEKLIFELFDNSVGNQIINEEYEKIKEEGIKRFKNKVPPGYKDSEKEENGDYYIFYSMIKYAKENKKHIIFVTDDTKEDWFMKVLGEKRGGDYRLLNEFFNKTKKLMLIYTSDGFLRAYQENLNKSKELDEKVLDELVNTRKYDIVNLNKKDKIYANQNELRELVFAIRNNIEEDKEILERIEKVSLSKSYPSNSPVYSILEMLKKSIIKNNEELKKILLNELDKYTDFIKINKKIDIDDNYYVLNIESKKERKKKIDFIIYSIKNTIKNNVDSDFESYCIELIHKIKKLIQEFEKNINYKDKSLIIEELGELVRNLEEVKENKNIDESIFKMYISLKIEDVLRNIKVMW